MKSMEVIILSEKDKMNILNVPAIFYFLGASFMLVMAFTIIGSNIDAMSSKVIFVGSIITTGAAAITPLFSMKILKLNSYKIKMYSITTGLVLGLISIYLFYIDNEIVLILFEYSSKGLLWIINISLLLFNLATLEIENNEEKMKKVSKELNEAKQQLIDRDRELIEKNKKLAEYQQKEIKDKRGN